ncbi:MbtH family NRPS accessory protein [Bradyrhizobium sp. AUGA SZCCT0274]|uniref:MbtH family protein n=1 Tax=Bradyrhizobium sp. AUGA SZCCT0274 TaxID=2807670 RepID=UPI001BA5D311|nr:MbtH family NRPS accessory protein [Bradyrhizobium sp. AUGA SZCCT0274]MBR1240322.1 MbtH family NRPS accessory protein [Bradyrhizobium sp. AUGA SZCCT0274]
MTDSEDQTATDDPYYIVRNHEEQYSIWAVGRPVPAGWDIVGDPGTKAACLATIETLWTDMRPASLRRAMDGDAAPASQTDAT